MNIRPSTSKDKPAIIDLLRKSLGESTIPKSEALWSWKHEQNPFGQSYVLIAEENDMLIGLRAFMQWEWRWNDQVFKAIRAVDTATDPGHQGKGIFKKLTLKQIELCKQDNIQFVFNTPNSQSMPGYLKMGWKVQGKMPLKIMALRPAATLARVLLQKKPSSGAVSSGTEDWSTVLQCFDKLTPLPIRGVHTPYSTSYIQWRYANNPLFPYSFLTDYKNYLLIYRIKEHSRFSELRITDFFVFNKEIALKRSIRKAVQRLARETSADLLTISGNQLVAYKDQLPRFGLIPVRNAGPSITLRDVTAGDSFNQFMNMKNWAYSMGDLELF
jgi:hypothetical protein